MVSKPASAWEKSSPELVALFEALAPEEPAISRKKMFGWPCCFVNGNLLAGLHKQSMIFRLSDADRLTFFKLDGTVAWQQILICGNPDCGKRTSTGVTICDFTAARPLTAR
jgi:hypothetical protein